MWSLEGGMDMLLVGLLQGALSYPFFDPVLTGEQHGFQVQLPSLNRLFSALIIYVAAISR
jgi:hypothetical protein